MADENRDMAAALQGGLLPAPVSTPSMIAAALASPLTNNHLRYPGDDPITELSQQRFAKADPYGLAMGIMGGPKGAPRSFGGSVSPTRSPHFYDRPIPSVETLSSIDANAKPLAQELARDNGLFWEKMNYEQRQQYLRHIQQQMRYYGDDF